MTAKTMTIDEKLVQIDNEIAETQKMLDECNAYLFKYKSIVAQYERYGFVIEPEEDLIDIPKNIC